MHSKPTFFPGYPMIFDVSHIHRFIVIGNNGVHAHIHILGALHVILTVRLAGALVVWSSERHLRRIFGVSKVLAMRLEIRLTLVHGVRDQSIVEAIVDAEQELLHARQTAANTIK